MAKDCKTLRPSGWEPKKPQQGRRAGRNPFYNKGIWRKFSKAYRLTHPLCECERCEKAIVPLPSHHVDHILPINPVNAFDTQNGKYGEPLDEDNVQALNIKCHARKSARERHNI